VLDSHEGTPVCIPVKRWDAGPFEAQACGFGAVMTTGQLLRDVQERFSQPFTPLPGFGEDFSFCLRARALGVFPWCDPSIRVDHIGISLFNEQTYIACQEADTRA
jgi:hypothetical protein